MTDDFKPLYELMNAGHAVAELAERIERGDLKWIDDYGRIVNAIDENQREALQCLAIHYSMDQGIPLEYAGEEAYQYWGNWEFLGSLGTEQHPLVRGGFISGSSYDAAKKPISTTERNHVSDKLTILNRAAAKFWGENIDRNVRDTHPTNAAVSA